MDLEAQVREAVKAELARQSDASEGGLTVAATDERRLTVNGDIDLEALAMVIVGSVAGGP